MTGTPVIAPRSAAPRPSGERRTFSATEQVRFTVDPGSVFAPDFMSSGTLTSLLTDMSPEVGAS